MYFGFADRGRPILTYMLGNWVENLFLNTTLTSHMLIEELWNLAPIKHGEKVCGPSLVRSGAEIDCWDVIYSLRFFESITGLDWNPSYF